jgi:exodeoxyribonuclease VII large subunit
MTPVLLYPILTQGDEAPDSIVRMLAIAAADGRCDVLLLARGGGSLEDLMAFNDERVARAVAACPLPVVTGIGHETDFTIADFVADQRAATPTAAATAAVPDLGDDRRRIGDMGRRLGALARARLDHHGQRLDWARSRLRHPLDRLRDVDRRLRAAQSRMRVSLRAAAGARRLALSRLDASLQRLSPAVVMARHALTLRHASGRLGRAMVQRQRTEGSRLTSHAARLSALDPAAVVRRGYAIVRSGDGRRVIRRAAELKVGDPLRAELAQGSLAARVEDVLDDAGPESSG